MGKRREAQFEEPPRFPALDLPVPDGMPWIEEGIRMFRTGGVRFDDHRQSLILRLAGGLDRALHLRIPWCGLFVYHCMKTAYPQTRTPCLPMRAYPWLGYGRETEPQVGALLVFWLFRPCSPFGHVGFYWAEDAEAYHVLGGNQRDSVQVQRVGRHRLRGARWPAEAWPPPGIRRSADPDKAEPFEFGEENDAEYLAMLERRHAQDGAPADGDGPA